MPSCTWLEFTAGYRSRSNVSASRAKFSRKQQGNKKQAKKQSKPTWQKIAYRVKNLSTPTGPAMKPKPQRTEPPTLAQTIAYRLKNLSSPTGPDVTPKKKPTEKEVPKTTRRYNTRQLRSINLEEEDEEDEKVNYNPYSKKYLTKKR